MSSHCSADWIDYGKSFCFTCLPSGIFQWVKGFHDSIFLVVSLLVAIMKDQVALKSQSSTSCYWHGMTIAVMH